ncbi:putative FAD-binding monooxygenase [Nocardia nova SH22a]|uniref:Putative FAD-binding monooxygenase n=1 Tax=Nocardia nova SH22a TaxID=1415166 RepID=W5TK84_9NOCA|nr:NAD(P)/FAD-dependent oxidoreductase [Nocardia nova]AHH19579.1 putative FAD-binding monooxygenase [Nocardia nova SH22a]
MRNSRQPSIAIIGSGFSGLGLAIRLKQAGFTELTIFEKADDVGGVWRDNTYPGAACDAPSHLYSYSFEPNPNWSRRFAGQPEILDYLRHCARKYDIRRHVRTGAEVTAADFDLAADAWTLTLADGQTATADILVSACGQLSRPAYPDLPGMDGFAGTVFHSARWDHDHVFDGRDVAVIGNGASAIQFVPHVAERARSLTVFQRQAHWISPKPDYGYPRLRKFVNRRIPVVQKLSRLSVFVWFEGVLNPMLVSPLGRRILSWPVRAWCRSNLRRIDDPELRARLLPSYEVGCNRILTSNDYYDTLNRANVGLTVNPIERVEPGGLVTADGTVHRADTIILATGFRSHDFVAPIRITGLGAADLSTVWRDRPHAYLGLTVPGFPNFFLMYGPNTNVGSGSIVHMLESQMNYIVGAARQLRRTGYLEVHPRVLERFDDAVQQRLATTVWNTGGCNSWYLAKTAAGPANTNNWPGSMLGYRLRTRRIRMGDYRTVPRVGPEVARDVQEVAGE